ncbi:hypothetical protein [Actinoplanes sp. CA-252034]|uniref:hypothetical protein n=1 Tax=Actinoplanes sp. CA-252034 TaxID=3239906 RepID=UPI003D99D47E
MGSSVDRAEAVAALRAGRNLCPPADRVVVAASRTGPSGVLVAALTPPTDRADRTEVVPRLAGAVGPRRAPAIAGPAGLLPVLVGAQLDGPAAAGPLVVPFDVTLVVPRLVGTDLHGARATSPAVVTGRVPAFVARVVPAVAGLQRVTRVVTAIVLRRTEIVTRVTDVAAPVARVERITDLTARITQFSTRVTGIPQLTAGVTRVAAGITRVAQLTAGTTHVTAGVAGIAQLTASIAGVTQVTAGIAGIAHVTAGIARITQVPRVGTTARITRVESVTEPTTHVPRAAGITADTGITVDAGITQVVAGFASRGPAIALVPASGRPVAPLVPSAAPVVRASTAALPPVVAAGRGVVAVAGGRPVSVVAVTARVARTLIAVVPAVAPVCRASPQLGSRRGVDDREVGFVEVDGEFGPVEVDVVEVVADEVVDGRVDGLEVGVVEPAGPFGVEGGLLAEVAVVGSAGAPAGRHDRVRNGTFGVVLLLFDRGARHERVLVVLVRPVLVVLEAHDAAPNRLGKDPTPRRRIRATVLTLYHLRTPVPPPASRDQYLPRGGCGRLTTDLRTAPPPCGSPSSASRPARER